MNLSEKLLDRLFALADVRINPAEPRPGDIFVKSADWVWRAATGGNVVELGDAYIRGDWDCKDLTAFFGKLIDADLGKRVPNVFAYMYRLKAVLRNQQDMQLSRRVARHYDRSAEFYRLMLGPDPMIYTSAYPLPGDDLTLAQVRKIEKLAQRSALDPGMRILDIGCGWGATLSYLTSTFNLRGTGISNSTGHVQYATKHYSKPSRCEYLECDYRQIKGRYQRVISVEMIEAVGLANLLTYFGKVAEVLEPGGRFVLQAISCIDPRHSRNAWLERNIFPGGELATEDQMISAAQKAGLELIDKEAFPEKYAWTLGQWGDNLKHNKDVVVERFGETLYRIYLLYVAMCEAGFAKERTSVGQMVFVKS